MIPTQFKYRKAETVEEAISLLQESDGEGKILAGGHSLLPLMKFRITSPGTIIDISRIQGLDTVKVEDGRLTLGALKTHYYISQDETVKKHLPALAKAASVIGDIQVRNHGTIGGNIAHGDPVSDYPGVAIALDTELSVISEEGSETMPLEGLVMGPLITMLPENGVVTEVSFEIPPEHAKQTYLKYFHPATDYPVIGVSAILGLDDDGIVDYIRIGITGVADVAYRARTVEDQLKGNKLTKELIEEASGYAAEDGDIGEDLFASMEYREHLTKVYVKRALAELF